MGAQIGVLLAGLLVGFTAFTAGAQPAADEPLTLDAVVQRFLARNLTLEAARHRVEGARADQIAAGLRPNPSLNLAAEQLKLSGPTSAGDLYEVSATYTQPFELGGKRRLRTEVADLGVTVAEHQLADVLDQRLGDVKQAFYDALAARRLLDLAVETRSAFDQLVNLIQARVREGAAAEGELLKLRVERMKHDNAVAHARLAADHAGIKLLDLIGDSDFSKAGAVVGDLARTPALSLDLAALREGAVMRPSVRAAETALAAAQRRVDLERARGTIDISPFVGVKRVGENNTVLLGISLPLPVSDRNQGGIARAIADEKTAGAELGLRRNQALAEVEAAYRAWQSAREQVAVFQDGLLQQADEARGIALAAYREGAIEVLGLLEAQRTHIDIRQQYVRTLQAYHDSLVTLGRAAGRDLGR
jgi:cobalt-zinc-cadmium efflux system outer membrane protein